MALYSNYAKMLNKSFKNFNSNTIKTYYHLFQSQIANFSRNNLILVIKNSHSKRKHPLRICSKEVQAKIVFIIQNHSIC